MNGRARVIVEEAPVHFGGRKVVYDDGELALFVPLWKAISHDATFKARIEAMCDVVLLADEIGIMDGSSPLPPELDMFAAEFREKARSIEPTLSDATVQELQFYCLYHAEGSAEYDHDEAARGLVQRRTSEGTPVE